MTVLCAHPSALTLLHLCYLRDSFTGMVFNGQTFKNIGRIREIIGVLVKYGFEDIVTNSTLRNFVTEKVRLSWMRQDKPVFQYSRWERIRMVCEELGPTFV